MDNITDAFKMQWYVTTLEFVNNDDLDWLKYPEMPLNHVDYIENLLKQRETFAGGEFKDVYRPLWDAMELHSWEIIRTSKKNNLDTGQIILERVLGRRKVKKQKKKNDQEENLNPKEPKKKLCKKMKKRDKIRKKNIEESYFYLSNCEMMKYISGTILKTSLERMLHFISTESEASIIFTDLEEMEAKFFQMFRNITKRYKFFETILSPECCDLFEKIRKVFSEKSVKLEFRGPLYNKATKKREVVFTKAPIYKRVERTAVNASSNNEETKKNDTLISNCSLKIKSLIYNTIDEEDSNVDSQTKLMKNIQSVGNYNDLNKDLDDVAFDEVLEHLDEKNTQTKQRSSTEDKEICDNLDCDKLHCDERLQNENSVHDDNRIDDDNRSHNGSNRCSVIERINDIVEDVRTEHIIQETQPQETKAQTQEIVENIESSNHIDNKSRNYVILEVEGEANTEYSDNSEFDKNIVFGDVDISTVQTKELSCIKNKEICDYSYCYRISTDDRQINDKVLQNVYKDIKTKLTENAKNINSSYFNHDETNNNIVLEDDGTKHLQTKNSSSIDIFNDNRPNYHVLVDVHSVQNKLMENIANKANSADSNDDSLNNDVLVDVHRECVENKVTKRKASKANSTDSNDDKPNNVLVDVHRECVENKVTKRKANKANSTDSNDDKPNNVLVDVHREYVSNKLTESIANKANSADSNNVFSEDVKENNTNLAHSNLDLVDVKNTQAQMTKKGSKKRKSKKKKRKNKPLLQRAQSIVFKKTDGQQEEETKNKTGEESKIDRKKIVDLIDFFSPRIVKLLKDLSVPLQSERGLRIMKSMGWSGGALGPRGNGIANPIQPVLDRKRREGLGHRSTNAADEIDTDLYNCVYENILDMIVNKKAGVVVPWSRVLSTSEIESLKFVCGSLNNRLGADVVFPTGVDTNLAERVLEQMSLEPNVSINIDFMGDSQIILKKVIRKMKAKKQKKIKKVTLTSTKKIGKLNRKKRIEESFFLAHCEMMKYISGTILKTCLERMLHFISTESEASIIFTDLEDKEARFFEVFQSIKHRYKVFERILSPECCDLFDKICKKFDEKTVKIKFMYNKCNKTTKKREVSFTKVPIYNDKTEGITENTISNNEEIKKNDEELNMVSEEGGQNTQSEKCSNTENKDICANLDSDRLHNDNGLQNDNRLHNDNILHSDNVLPNDNVKYDDNELQNHNRLHNENTPQNDNEVQFDDNGLQNDDRLHNDNTLHNDTILHNNNGLQNDNGSQSDIILLTDNGLHKNNRTSIVEENDVFEDSILQETQLHETKEQAQESVEIIESSSNSDNIPKNDVSLEVKVKENTELSDDSECDKVNKPVFEDVGTKNIETTVVKHANKDINTKLIKLKVTLANDKNSNFIGGTLGPPGNGIANPIRPVLDHKRPEDLGHKSTKSVHKIDTELYKCVYENILDMIVNDKSSIVVKRSRVLSASEIECLKLVLKSLNCRLGADVVFPMGVEKDLANRVLKQMFLKPNAAIAIDFTSDKRKIKLNRIKNKEKVENVKKRKKNVLTDITLVEHYNLSAMIIRRTDIEDFRIIIISHILHLLKGNEDSIRLKFTKKIVNEYSKAVDDLCDCVNGRVVEGSCPIEKLLLKVIEIIGDFVIQISYCGKQKFINITKVKMNNEN